MSQATIQKIHELTPAENSDNLAIAHVMGWQVVVRKDEFKVNDLCIYVEIDTQMPEKPEYKFLEPRRYRVRPAKLRGNISQGLILPLSVLPEGSSVAEGDSVDELIGASHYEKPAAMDSRPAGAFPTHIINVTDEPLGQSNMKFLKAIIRNNDEVYITTKMDGSSGTFYKFNEKIGVCSRHLELKTDEECPDSYNRWLRVYHRYEMKTKLEQQAKNIAVQGEVYGVGIQQNRMKISDIRTAVFDVWDIDNRKYYDYDDLVRATTEMNIPMVPVLHVGPLGDLISIPEGDEDYKVSVAMKGLEEFAKTVKYEAGTRAEGIVIRPKKNYSIRGGRVSFKVLNVDYLLEEKKELEDIK